MVEVVELKIIGLIVLMAIELEIMGVGVTRLETPRLVRSVRPRRLAAQLETWELIELEDVELETA